MKRHLIFLHSKGTTIIEALVVIIILSLGLIPSLTVILAVNSISSSIINDLVAANLAQEGIEVIRAVRDANWFSTPPRLFDAGLSAGIYRVQYNSVANGSTTFLLAEDGNPSLKIDANGLYNYTTGDDTNFRRRITIVKDPTLAGCNCELRIISEVTWPVKKTTRTLTVEAHLFNWR